MTGCGANDSSSGTAGKAGGGSGGSGGTGVGGAGATGGGSATGGTGATGTGGSGTAGTGGVGTGGSAGVGTGGVGTGGGGGAGTGGAAGVGGGTPLDNIVHINQIQNEGTHNSYHTAGPVIPDWQYTHLPLDAQLQNLGVRHFELDVHYAAAGFLVHHVPPDIGTTCSTWVLCLQTIKNWSDSRPGHHIIFVVLEPKDEFDLEKIAGHYDQLETEALSVWPRQRVMTPDDVRGTYANLREAVTTVGWPTLGATRNKIAFFLMGGEADYIKDPALTGKLMFVRANESDPHAAILKLEEPPTDEAAIRDAVRAGFIVRTRYNGGSLAFDQNVIDAALRSGAQLISGDFPDRFSIPNGDPSRCSPINAPPECVNAQIE